MAEVDITTKKIGDKVMVNIPGDLDTMEKADRLKDTLNHLCREQGETEIILNLNKTSKINSYGIGKILMFHKRLKEDGGSLYITPPTDAVREIFEILMLDNVLKVYRG
ncbi:MAG: STAS domain-containing protein [Thermodesulfobacteriota bacterium]